MFTNESNNEEISFIKKDIDDFENCEENFHDTQQGVDENSESQLLCLSESPIYFEPISQLTNVFFDRDNQQIFCVRSNGVGGLF
jgi:hypothetical protein